MGKYLNISDEAFEELQRTGNPIVVRTENGLEVVVQDAEAYRRMVELVSEADLAQIGRACAQRWQELQDGEDTGLSAEEFFSSIRTRMRRTG